MSDSHETCVVRLVVEGMTCGACSTSVTKALLATPGVTNASVAHTTNSAEVYYLARAEITHTDIKKAVDDCGFTATIIDESKAHSIKFLVAEIGATALRSKGILAHIAAERGIVGEALFDPVGPAVTVYYDPHMTGPRTLFESLMRAGYDPEVTDDAGHLKGLEANIAKTQNLRRSFLTCLVLTVPIFINAKAHMFFPALMLGFPADELLKWSLTSVVMYVLGMRFHTGAIAALRRRSANMDVLVSLGTNAAYLYSAVSILDYALRSRNDHHSEKPVDFFDGAAMLITFILLGKWLEARAAQATYSKLTSLMSLTPENAALVTLDDMDRIKTEQRIDSRLIQLGDILYVLPSSKVPADGTLLQGETSIDESMVTGENLPVGKLPGDPVIGGTINRGKAFLMTVTRVGSDTVLNEIVRLVHHAQMSKAPVQKYADYISSIFVPVIVVLAVLTIIVWWVAGAAGAYPSEGYMPRNHSVFVFSLLFGISVLVIACPCAIGLATPTAIMVGTGIGAANGVFIKGGEALERGAGANTVVFDKTGTITYGRPQVVDCKEIFPEQTRAPSRKGKASRKVQDSGTHPRGQRLRVLMGSLEAESEHPLASAIVNWAAAGVKDQAGAARESATPAGERSSRGSSRSMDNVADRSWMVPVTDVEALDGMGLVGLVVGSDDDEPSTSEQEHGAPVRLAIGNEKLMEELRVNVRRRDVQEWVHRQQQMKRTGLFVAYGKQAVACIAIEDPIKPEAAGVVARLKEQNIDVHLLTGDNWQTASSIAERIGITHVTAEVLPADKEAEVQRLRDLDRIVAMVGDGTNDAPALAAADVGIAIGSGTTVAIDAADYVLTRSDLEDVVVALDLSRRTFARIRINYMWAWLYNGLMIPVAAGVLYPAVRFQMPPWFAGIAMVLSSISVVLSSLMLSRYKRPPPVPRDFSGLQDTEAESSSSHASSSHQSRRYGPRYGPHRPRMAR